MQNHRTSAMLDSLIAAGDEGLSFDNIVSIPEMAVEDMVHGPRMADWLDDGLELFLTSRAAVSQVAARLRQRRAQESLTPTMQNSSSLLGSSRRRDNLQTQSSDPLDSAVSRAFPVNEVQPGAVNELAEEVPRGTNAPEEREETCIPERLPRKPQKQVPDNQKLRSNRGVQLSEETLPIDNWAGRVDFKSRSAGERFPISLDSAVRPDTDRAERLHVDRPSNERNSRENTEKASPSSSSVRRCPTCKSRSQNPRNLVVLIDGTSMKFGPQKSNVRKLSCQIEMDGSSGTEQHKHYLKGIGAYEDEHRSWPRRMRNAMRSAIEMGFACNVGKNVKDAYGWLAEKYRKGDRIYLFGFSRGAYQVRVLASMIHEVGLVRERQDIERAYNIFWRVDRYKRSTPDMVNSFKKEFCWDGVRIHFVGVWDTVSSVSLSGYGIPITASATVTNACHFRHALALDERRVKFMPEYFAEVNARRHDPHSDVKEVWFAGCHSDVGGANQQHNPGGGNEDLEFQSIHAGNVSLSWMSQEAAKHGLVLGPEAIAWGPHDVDLGREESLKGFWKIYEIFPVRHQVSFSGTGGYKRRWHRSRPRSVIPGQQIHSSVLSGDLYTPRATLGLGIDIPRASRSQSNALTKGTMSSVPQTSSFNSRKDRQMEANELWVTDRLDESAMTHLLTTLLSDPQRTLGSLERVLFLLVSKLIDEHTPMISKPQWIEDAIAKQSHFAKFGLIVICDITSNLSISEERLRDARQSLYEVLSCHPLHYLPGILYFVRFLARHKDLRERFISHVEVVEALILALDRTAKSRNESLFPLVMSSLCSLVTEDVQRAEIISQLITPNGAENGQTRLSLVLEAKAPSHLMASLNLITHLAQYQQGHFEGLIPRIIDLAKRRRGPIGVAAVEALVVLNVPLSYDSLFSSGPVAVAAVQALVVLNLPLPHDILFSNILGYLSNTLPRLDVETGRLLSRQDPKTDSTSSANDTATLPSVLRAKGSLELDVKFMCKLVRTINSSDTHERTLATLTFLKLCNHRIVRDFCSTNKVLDVFMKQLGRKETSLLAAYALKTCLMYDMWTCDHFHCVAERILNMFDKGWFDDAIGRLEGLTLFSDFMTSDDLRQEVFDGGIVDTLKKKFEKGGRHAVRMSLICLDILAEGRPMDLESYVDTGLGYLNNNDRNIRKKGVRLLSALAQTKIGEQAIMQHVGKVVEMLSSYSSPDAANSPQLDAVIAVLYRLVRNDALWAKIKQTPEYDRFRTMSAAQRWSRVVW